MDQKKYTRERNELSNSYPRKLDKNYSNSRMNNYDNVRLSNKKHQNVYEITMGKNTVGSESQTIQSGGLYESLNTKQEENHTSTYDTLEVKKNSDNTTGFGNKGYKRHLVYGFVGLIIGAVIASLVVFFVLKLKQPKDDNKPTAVALNINTTVCFWSTWSQWSECHSPSGNGLQQRMKQQIGSSRKCNSSTDIETRSCIDVRYGGDEVDMKFNPSTLHSSRYLSIDNTILGNQLTDQTPRKSGIRTTLKTYTGVMADKCFMGKMKIYYEVEYQYTILKQLSSTNLILEVGLAQRDQIDRNDFVGNVPKGWSFAIARCGVLENVCLRAKHNRVLDINNVISSNQVGLKKMGTFGVLIDRVKNEFSIKMKSTNVNFVISFQNVTSDIELCPVFGVHHKDKVNVTLRLMNTRNVTSIPFDLK